SANRDFEPDRHGARDPSRGEEYRSVISRRRRPREHFPLAGVAAPMARGAGNLSRDPAPRAIVLGDAAAFPRATSGEIQRHALEAQFNEDIELTAAETSVEQQRA
ncbi:MAG: hypothetical protein ACPGVX_11930, partial [Thalassobaculaceae bacterium]